MAGGQGDRELPGNTELLDQTNERLTEIIRRGFLGVALAVCTHTWTQLGVSAPHANVGARRRLAR
jgi:hypothetical protein